MEDLIYQLALSKIPKIGPKTAKNLISYCGSAHAVFKSKRTSLSKIPGIGLSLVERIANNDAIPIAQREIDFAQKNGIKILSYLSPDFPKRMLHHEDCPIILYHKGNANFNHTRNVAIVGTRKPSELGKDLCRTLVEDLKKFNIQIISGLAFGIDHVAHNTSVKNGIPNIGILGHGLHTIYPIEHRKLAREIIKNGSLLTEFGNGTKPDRENFPMRNRLIASMCDALVVVESDVKGGSIISAEFGNLYGKDVFAFPGRVSDKYSSGCNKLIKTHKAALIESASDIAYLLRWEDMDKSRNVQRELFVSLAKEEKEIVDLIRKEGDMGIDVLNGYLKLPASRLASVLLDLEFKGIIKSIPGKRFVLS